MRNGDEEMVDVTLSINGKSVTKHVEPRRLLVDFIRHDVGLKGTHVGCEHGVCGACTVSIDGQSARSCLHFAVAVQGREIETIEGLTADGQLQTLQDAFHEEHALQCGFCTPGILLTVHEFLREAPNPTQHQIREALTNNLCRCTGYVNIVKAVASVAKARTEGSSE
jgi:aerobic-type carbon monoxide dehydrogenase small subunit (CoxS/CutS family)